MPPPSPLARRVSWSWPKPSSGSKRERAGRGIASALAQAFLFVYATLRASQLDWRPLVALMREVHSSKKRTAELQGMRSRGAHAKALGALLREARHFFAPGEYEDLG